MPMESQTLTLSEFLLARYAEEDAVARDAGVRVGLPYESSLYVVDDGYRHNQVGIYPERVLAECEAKRRIVEAAWHDHLSIEGEYGSGRSREEMEAAGIEPDVVAHLASVYADHPDYRPEWRA